jgi:hypothetical protein
VPKEAVMLRFARAFAKGMDDMARSIVGWGGLLDRRRNRVEYPEPQEIPPLPRSGSSFEAISADLAAVSYGFCVVFRAAANDVEKRREAERV